MKNNTLLTNIECLKNDIIKEKEHSEKEYNKLDKDKQNKLNQL